MNYLINFDSQAYVYLSMFKYNLHQTNYTWYKYSLNRYIEVLEIWISTEQARLLNEFFN